MVYGEVFIPQIGEGLVVRLGRYIAIPDIEAQLAPNNLHVLPLDDLCLRQLYQRGPDRHAGGDQELVRAIGRDDWHRHRRVAPGPDGSQSVSQSGVPQQHDASGSRCGAFPDSRPSLAEQLGGRQFHLVANGINGGQWGYNNLQWFGGTYYHKFDEQWHLAFEMYTLSQRNVLNQNNAEAQTIMANGGYPFTVANGFNYNAPNFAQCNAALVSCTARVVAAVAYLNYKFSALDNISFRPEFYDDMAGQRTGVKTRYANFGVGWQHLVLAAARTSSGSGLLSLPRRQRLQRQYRCLPGFRQLQGDRPLQEFCLDRIDGSDPALLIVQLEPRSCPIRHTGASRQPPPAMSLRRLFRRAVAGGFVHHAELAAGSPRGGFAVGDGLALSLLQGRRNGPAHPRCPGSGSIATATHWS